MRSWDYDMKRVTLRILPLHVEEEIQDGLPFSYLSFPKAVKHHESYATEWNRNVHFLVSYIY
jgi:hypothetical protein